MRICCVRVLQPGLHQQNTTMTIGGKQSPNFTSYSAGGKRSSNESAASGTSLGCVTPEKVEKGELVDTYAKLNVRAS